jgi:hypothetical protein
MFDGEGTLSISGDIAARSSHLTVAQKPGPVLSEIVRLLKMRGVDPYVRPPDRNHGVTALTISRHWETMCLLGSLRPMRLLDQFDAKCFNVWTLPKGRAAVTRVEAIGTGQAVAVQTSTRTLITEGFVSHNSHIHDALQYACNGVARLQYAQERDEEAPPLPVAWLGSMRRNLRPARRPQSQPEVVSSRSRRDIRVRFPRIDE